MEEKKLSRDGFQWLYRRYIGDNRERQASFQEELARADIASQIFDIRNKLRMSREDLGEFSGLTPEAIEDLEESDYAGSWEEAIMLINGAFERWIKEVIVPAAQLKPEEYSVKVVNA